MHLEALRNIEAVEVVALVDPRLDAARKLAQEQGISHVASDLDEALKQGDVDAVILCTPTPLHAAQAISCLHAGKHVLIEIPLADNLTDARRVLAKQQETGLVAMVGHVRRFNPPHRYIHRKIRAGELKVQQMEVQTHFLRRSNINAAGEPRSWTDHLLWHHAAHGVDLFQFQTSEEVVECHAIEGPRHPQLGIAMDLSTQLKSRGGAICTMSLSFNNDGPLGSFFRYICDNGTYVARYDELVTGTGLPVDTGEATANGLELQDREFIVAIREGREPNSSVRQLQSCYELLDRLERQLSSSASPRGGGEGEIRCSI
jgi:2-hydroxy-4-carboxymuconate semialdehyde hemiacetal dehydrogenase